MHPLSQSHLRVTKGEPTQAARKAEAKKLLKYERLQPRYIFTPIALETLGAWGPSASKFFRELGARQQVKFGSKQANNFLCQRISIELQRSNAKCFMWSLH